MSVMGERSIKTVLENFNRSAKQTASSGKSGTIARCTHRIARAGGCTAAQGDWWAGAHEGGAVDLGYTTSPVWNTQ